MAGTSIDNAKQSSHTPGPWAIQSTHPGNGRIAIGVPGIVDSLCELRSIRCHDNIANARLIAAAPDLLAALKAIDADYAEREYMEDYPPRAIARAAIAKAEGGAA